jgi:hypothetical protein
LLKQRGEYIINNEYDEAREIEKEIITLKNEQKKNIIRPVDAFIIFE